MKDIEIDLSESFERVVEGVLSLSKRGGYTPGDAPVGEQELRQAVRGLYEAANGRQVETGIGLIAIAPPIAPSLKAIPFRAGTLLDFLVAATARIVSLAFDCSRRSAPALPENERRQPRTSACRGSKGRSLRTRAAVRPFHRPSGPDFVTPQITAAHHD
jgi:hypothetical protein